MADDKKTVGNELRLLDRLLDEQTRLVKKYLLDAKGQLKLYHPLTQNCIFKVLKGEPVDLLAELREYDVEKRKEKN